MHSGFDDPRLTAVGLLVETHGGLTARLNEVHFRHGLTGIDFDALIRIARSPDQQLRLGDLAAQTGLSTSGITRIVDRLERGELVRRTRSPGDRRGWAAVLTDTGLARLEQLLPDLLAAIERYLTGQLTPDQLDALLDALHRIRRAVRPDATAGATPAAE
ncbi:MAG: MarR family transcriptional regulator [Streptosporangiales bacterium]|nr:MarR family transcriptional regulator [Streptosporangiales bacterium]